MKNVLMISYVFPPMAAVGGYRTIKYCKFLPQFGWQPVVLTVKSGYNVAYDQSLLNQIDSSVSVYRSNNFEPLTWWEFRSQTATQGSEEVLRQAHRNADSTSGRSSAFARPKSYLRKMLSVPDRNSFWIPSGVWTGLKAVRSEKIQVIHSSSPPASAHLVGYWLSLLTGRPLVVDFRDLWTQNEGYQLRRLPPLLRKLDRFLEKRVVDHARAIITTTETFARQLRENNPNKDPDSVCTITNGIDPDDLTRIRLPEKKNERFTILHLGSLYGHRDPAFFFNVMVEWAKARPEVLQSVRVDFIGNAPGYEEIIAQSPLDKVISLTAHIPHNRVLAKLWEADLLLLILGFSSSGSGVLPAKVFEYVCTERPILALAPTGEAQAVVDKHKGSLTVTGPDVGRTMGFLNEQFDLWLRSDDSRNSRVNIPSQFDRRTLAGKLTEVLNTV